MSGTSNPTQTLDPESLSVLFVNYLLWLPALKNIIRQAADALYYLHKKGIIHRDLKCENILVVRSPQSQFDIEIRITGRPDSWRCILTLELFQDFGLAVISGQEFQESTCGTPLYMAPEILLRHSYSLQCDIWRLLSRLDYIY